MTSPATPEGRPAGLGADARVLAVVPHLACHDWLAGALGSLLAQTRPLDGIVVVDDASEDPPVDIVAAHPGVTLLHAAENVGPYRLVQQVIDATVHDAILFQDADDWSAPERLERLLEASARTGAELVGSDYVVLDTQRWSARRHLFPLDANAALRRHPTGHAQHHPAGLVARSLVARVGGYATGMRFSGDDEFLRRAAWAGKVVNVPRPLYHRRQRSSSLTTSPTSGHGTPARRAVLDEMRERARANVAAVAAGSPPDLSPMRTRGPVELAHLCGPTLEALNGRARRPRPPAATAGGRPRRPGEPPRPAPGRGASRVLVVGAPGSGADAVATALGQHPAIAAAGDVSWAAAFGEATSRAAGAADGSSRAVVAGTRPATAFDGLLLDAERAAALLAPALDAMILDHRLPPDPERDGDRDGDGHGPAGDGAVLAEVARRPLAGRWRWVGTAPAQRDTLAHLLALFGDAHVVHVVRDVDEVAALGGLDGAPAAGDAVAAWHAATDVALDLEAALGDRVQRILLADVTTRPEPVLRALLARLGEDYHPAVALPFTPPAAPVRQPPHPAVPAGLRRLSQALHGPGRPAVGHPGPATPPASPPPQSPGPGSAAPARATPFRPRDATHPSVPSAVALVDRYVPDTEVVAVVSRGDDALLRFRATGLHLPATSDGRYAGHHPADDAEAMAALAAARDRGARWLLVPVTSAWWLDHYRGLADHLGAHARRAGSDQGHVLFAVHEEGTGTDRSAGARAGGHADGAAGGQVAHGRAGPGRSVGAAALPVDGRHVPAATSAAGRHRPDPRERRQPPRGRRPKVHVVSWSVSHNPLGRAHLLAEVLARSFEVEVVGATFDRFGGGVWEPVRRAGMPVRTFRGGDLHSMLPEMERFAATLDGDAVVVAKPRLPGLALAMLAVLQRRRPVVLDVDDHELAFVGADTGLTLDDVARLGDDPVLDNPFGGPWTRCCDGLVADADAVTVSNPTLQGRYGGEVVGHARDETLFDPARYDRARARADAGFADDDRIVLFGGTPRRHKGVVDVAAALARTGDPRRKLCLIDTPELGELAADLAEYAAHVVTVPPRGLTEMPALLAAADAVVALQDPASPVAAYQIPAKVTDALAMGVPCLVRRVPPLQHLVDADAVTVADGDLAEALWQVLEDPAARRRAGTGRELFRAELSYAAVAPRLARIVGDHLGTDRPVPLSFERTVTLARQVADRQRARRARPAPRRPRRQPALVGGPAPDLAAAGATVAGVPAAYDVVMFWKQNDTGIYDRRHDMILDQLARSPRIRRVVQFDHPIGSARLEALAAEGPTSHGRLVARQTRARLVGAADTPGVARRTFVYESRHRDDPGRRGHPYPAKGEHLDVVARTLADAGIGSAPVVVWGYPMHLELPALVDAIGPDLVVMDVVDDHRTWRPDPAGRDEVARHYADVLSHADLTLVNCRPMADAMARFAGNVHVVPNGCEWPPRPVGPPPAELASLAGPVVGYVGNLSSRIDVDLLDTVARTRPDWNLVLVGSTHAGSDVLVLDEHPNVHLVGPRVAREARAWVEAFDVAIIPHVDDPMTRHMHPLKAFVYCAAGVPVVATLVGNLDELAPLVTVAATQDAFVEAVGAAVARGRRPLDAEARALLASHAWTARIADVERLLDDAWRQR
ncbi:MAG TPA: glycosyltransferase [Acidimicrobiales bacterium]|nr:glycosyltransferase [Acidimicrobiales bacterium]